MCFQTNAEAFALGGTQTLDDLAESMRERLAGDTELSNAVESWIKLARTGRVATSDVEILYRTWPGGANFRIPADIDIDLTRYGVIDLINQHTYSRSCTRVAIPTYSPNEHQQLFGPAFIDTDNYSNRPVHINYSISIGEVSNKSWSDQEFSKLSRPWFSDLKPGYFEVERAEECRSRFLADKKIVFGKTQMIPVFTVVDPEDPDIACQAHAYDLLRALYHHKPDKILGHIAFPPDITARTPQGGLELVVIQSMLFVAPSSDERETLSEITPQIPEEILARRRVLEGVRAKNSLDHETGDRIKNGEVVLGYPILNMDGKGWVPIVNHDMPVLPGALSSKWRTNPAEAERDEIQKFTSGEGINNLGAPQQRPWWNAFSKIQNATLPSPLEPDADIPLLCPIFTKMDSFSEFNITGSMCIELYAYLINYNDPFRLKFDREIPHPKLVSSTQDIHKSRNIKSHDLELPRALWYERDASGQILYDSNGNEVIEMSRREPMTDRTGRGFTEVEAIYSMHDVSRTEMAFHFASRLSRLTIECPHMKICTIFPMLILNKYWVDGLDNPDVARRMMNLWVEYENPGGVRMPDAYEALGACHENEMQIRYIRDENGFIHFPYDVVSHPLDHSLNEFYDKTYRRQSECTVPVFADDTNISMGGLRRFFIDDSSLLDTRSVRRMDSVYMVNFLNRYSGTVEGEPRLILAQPEVFTSWSNNPRFSRPLGVNLSSPHEGFDNYYLMFLKRE